MNTRHGRWQQQKLAQTTPDVSFQVGSLISFYFTFSLFVLLLITVLLMFQRGGLAQGSHRRQNRPK